ncbi:hypothetical protein OsI_28505 [Oryza sativa Indica Group]|uniref:Uncharacterized protein n=1 Tax=Oryza sativa subsp. indica TaxID=39946 RepID=A2YT58_ORYSI|nr:hypothetical protein OsI_28505 [Oryza sativa Indica Group]
MAAAGSCCGPTAVVPPSPLSDLSRGEAAGRADALFSARSSGRGGGGRSSGLPRGGGSALPSAKSSGRGGGSKGGALPSHPGGGGFLPDVYLFFVLVLTFLVFDLFLDTLEFLNAD